MATVQLILLLVVRIEVVEEQVVIFDTIFEVIHDFLLFVDFDTEAAPVIEDIIVVIDRMVDFAGEAATPCYDQLAFSLKRVFILAITSTTRPHFFRLSSRLQG